MSDFSSTPLGSSVNGSSHVHRPSLHVESLRATSESSPLPPHQRGEADRVEVSAFAQLLDRLRQMPAVRHDRVETARENVKSDSYVTEEKVDAAITQWAREEL